MKKSFLIILFMFLSLSFVIFTGCKDPEPPHEHTYSDSWTKDATHHWHASTCGHEVTEGKAAHSFGDWEITKEPTEEETGSREKSCTVCGYKVTEAIEKLEHKHTYSADWTKDATHHWHASTCGHEVTDSKAAHSFGDWTTTKEATEEAEGSKERTCTVCGYTATEVISKLDHTHKFAEEWTSNSSGHWHAATCEHTDEKSGFAEHSFGVWKVVQEPTDTQAGRNERTCKYCAYVVDSVVLQPAPEGFRFVKGTTITGTERWTPSSSVFVSRRSLTIPDLIVSDHEVTRGEYLEVMKSDPSTADAYDKDGNELEGENVLNNPVNYVNWYGALVYCNKLSMKENLTPCYSIDGSTDPGDWGEVPTGDNSKWNAATCNFEADGYRLPTEAEWEWLARGGENYRYAGSDTGDDVAWYSVNTNDTGTREVKTKAPNGYGLYDMIGNVWEWCWDWYGAGISDSTAADGASSGYFRVCRGSSWFSLLGGVAFRADDNPYYRSRNNGLRVVRSAN